MTDVIHYKLQMEKEAHLKVRCDHTYVLPGCDADTLLPWFT